MNTQKRFARIARALILGFGAALALLVTATSAFAQRPAYVKNVDEPGRIPYQQAQSFNSGACIPTHTCLISFPAVPAGKRLIIEHVTMLIFTAGSTPPDLVAFGDGPATNVDNKAIIKRDFVSTPTVFGETMHTLDRPARVYYEAGDTPRIKFAWHDLPGAATSNVTMHGYLIDANN